MGLEGAVWGVAVYILYLSEVESRQAFRYCIPSFGADRMLRAMPRVAGS